MQYNQIYLISCMYAGPLKEEQKRQALFWNWFYKEETKKKFEELGYPPGTVEVLLADRNDKFDLRDSYGNLIPYDDLVAKGLAIRFKFKAILKSAAERGKTLTDNDLVIYIDGDGQISFDYVFEMVKYLKEEKAIISCRGNKFGIENDRKIVEHFENFLVSEKTSFLLPDAQCGFWGFRAVFLNKLLSGISASGFDIELNLALALLIKNILPSYIPIKIDTEGPTEFNERDHLRKLNFLLNQIKWGSGILPELHKLFIKRYTSLPDGYVKLFFSSELPAVTKETYSEKGTSKQKLNCLNQCDRTKLPSWHICYKKS